MYRALVNVHGCSLYLVVIIVFCTLVNWSVWICIFHVYVLNIYGDDIMMAH